jgi:threonine dehydrogenase-like Zn-dependent dehydrogenase
VQVRAAVLRSGTLETRETADPVPGRGQLLLKVLSCAICASDVHFMDHPDAVADDETGLWDYRRDEDIVMGHEFVGEVLGHGDDADVDTFPLGARVTSSPVLDCNGTFRIIGCSPEAPGGFGELMLVQDVFARRIPDHVPIDHAALADPLSVGDYYVHACGIDATAVPIVVGAGGIGLCVVVALARRGIRRIVVVDHSVDRLATAKALGASHVVDPRERSPYELWNEIVLGDAGASAVVAGERMARPKCFVFEFVGLPGVLDGIVRECPPNTHILTGGGAPEGDHISSAVAKKKGVSMLFGGGPMLADFGRVVDALVAGDLDPGPIIGMSVDLDGVPDAFDLARRAEGPARIMIHPHGAVA